MEMPFPQNLDFALEAESTCKSQGVTPATVAIIDGTVCVGLEKEELDLISRSKDIKKVSMRSLVWRLVLVGAGQRRYHPQCILPKEPT